MDELGLLTGVLAEIDGVTFQTLEGRVAFQKRIYLAQAVGLPLGYGFSWNMHGPYSRELAEDGRRLAASQSSPPTPRFTRLAHKAFARYRDLTGNAPAGLTEGAWLELLASMHYLRIHTVGIEAGRERIVERLERLKPYLTTNESALDEAWRRLDQLIEHAADYA